MIWDTIIAGFGGQGVLFAGRVLAQAAMLEGLEVTWLPSYGPQMRGGTANCSVVVSDQAIHSPLVLHPRGLIALNQPSLNQFGPLVRSGGLVVANSSLIHDATASRQLTVLIVPASEIAQRLGSVRSANMVALGAYLGSAQLLSASSIQTALQRALPSARADLYELNLAAFQEGTSYGEAATHQSQSGHVAAATRPSARALPVGENSGVCDG